MAASSGDDILAQLAALLGRESVCHIRKTDTVPPQINVIDVAATITGKSQDAAAQDFRRMSKKYPDVNAKKERNCPEDAPAPAEGFTIH